MRYNVVTVSVVFAVVFAWAAISGCLTTTTEADGTTTTTGIDSESIAELLDSARAWVPTAVPLITTIIQQYHDAEQARDIADAEARLTRWLAIVRTLADLNAGLKSASTWYIGPGLYVVDGPDGPISLMVERRGGRITARVKPVQTHGTSRRSSNEPPLS